MPILILPIRGLHILFFLHLLQVVATAQPQQPSWQLDAQQCKTDGTLSQEEQRACERIEHGLRTFEQHGERIGVKSGQFIEQISTRTVTKQGRVFDRIAERNELDANNGRGPRAWQEYARYDSREVALHNETFPPCFEERRVLNPLYEAMCALNCPKQINPVPGCPREPPFLPNNHYVSEYYFPYLEVAVNKSGSRAGIDVTMFQGADNRPELTREQTKQRYENQMKPAVAQLLQRLGIEEEVSWPEWHTPGDQEFFLQKNSQPLDVMGATEYYPISYETNVHAQATRNRPRAWWLGYELENTCFFSALLNPAHEIIKNAADGELPYMQASMAAEFTQLIEPEAYQATVQLPYRLETGRREQLPNTQEHAQRMQRWNNPFSDLQTIGAQPGAHRRDWVFIGHSLAPFNVTRNNAWMNPVYQGISLAVTHAYLSGSKAGALAQANTANRRSNQFTRAMPRESKAGYAGDGAVKERILFTDKIQLAYPPLEGGPNGGRKGSHCFRPENLAPPDAIPQPEGRFARSRMAKSTNTNHFSIPYDLIANFPDIGLQAIDMANEVRIIVYNKQVTCFCQHCGIFKGCLTLNDGDLEEDRFYGTVPFVGGGAAARTAPQLTPIDFRVFRDNNSDNQDRLAQTTGGGGGGFSPGVNSAMPALRGLAGRQAPPPQGIADPTLSIPSFESGSPGPLQTVPPQGQQQVNGGGSSPSIPNLLPLLPPLLLACSLNNQNQGEGGSESTGGAAGSPSGPSGGGPSLSGGAPGGCST